MDFSDLGFDRGYSGMRAYGRSKLANILFTYELAKRLENSTVSVNALHPGHVATDIWKTSVPLLGSALKWIMGKVALSPEEGADNSIFLASSSEVEGVSGKYFIGRKSVQSSGASYDENISKRLWEISEGMTSSKID
jgi:NAD(P)-dependent dehydrogenase (short-subunit alcohol dehydrogenase family)